MNLLRYPRIASALMKGNRLVIVFAVHFGLSILAIGASPREAQLAFSDPAKSTVAPAWAVGQADRNPELDARPGFEKPPAGFGVVPFFGWVGDPLTQDRLGWILKQMEGMGVSGYQINYAHNKQDGGQSFGLSMPSDPPLFSESWWELSELFRWSLVPQNCYSSQMSASHS